MNRCRKHLPEFEDTPLNFNRVFCSSCGRKGLLSNGRSRTGKRRIIWLTTRPPTCDSAPTERPVPEPTPAIDEGSQPSGSITRTAILFT